MLSRRISPEPLDMLWRFALGYMPDFARPKSQATGWASYSHRGVQYLDQLQFPAKVRRHIHNPHYELRINQAFAEVVRACAQAQRSPRFGHQGRTWIGAELITGLLRLHALGYAHSYETWSDGHLVGGGFGIQLGGYVTINSLFHVASHASKFASGRAMLHLRERGFRMVDVGMVPQDDLNFGAQWIRRWKFEEEMRSLLVQTRSVGEDWPCRPIPWAIRLSLPAVRVLRAWHDRWNEMVES